MICPQPLEVKKFFLYSEKIKSENELGLSRLREQKKFFYP